MGDVVKVETVRLPLPDGQFIDVKKRLNHGEQEDLFAEWSPYIEPGKEARLQRRVIRDAKVHAYLVGWSLVDDDGAPIPYAPHLPDADRRATIAALDPDRFTEIHSAIEAHEAAETAARAAQKKTPAGSPAADLTSRSRFAAAGGSTGSAPLTRTTSRS